MAPEVTPELWLGGWPSTGPGAGAPGAVITLTVMFCTLVTLSPFCCRACWMAPSVMAPARMVVMLRMAPESAVMVMLTATWSVCWGASSLRPALSGACALGGDVMLVGGMLVLPKADALLIDQTCLDAAAHDDGMV